MESLVGLKAVDVVKKLAECGYFTLSSYGKPIGMVIPHVESREDLIKLFKLLEKEVLNGKEED